MLQRMGEWIVILKASLDIEEHQWKCQANLVCHMQHIIGIKLESHRVVVQLVVPFVLWLDLLLIAFCLGIDVHKEILVWEDRIQMLDIIFKCKMHFHTPDHHSHDACLGINVYVMFTLVKNWFIQGFVIHSSFTASFLFVRPPK